jgi:hypothetical protein
MPLQNRVKPDGEIVFSRSRGTMMGNRGNLHDDSKHLVRQTRHYLGWVTCLLQYKGTQRELMTPGEYTELFFLDEATAFSAGHRPCAYCQRGRFKEFKEAWLRANAIVHPLLTTSIKDIDAILQEERIDKQGQKVTYAAQAGALPNGTFVLLGDDYFLKWKGKLLQWTFSGYVSAVAVPDEEMVDVLTPRSVVRCFEQGFSPKVHESANDIAIDGQ